MVFRTTKGSITIYSTLVFTVVISLILVLAESARISGARTMLLSRVALASNSVLAGYEEEIYDNYKIFAYDGKSNDVAAVKENISNAIKEYMCLDSTGWNKDFMCVTLEGIDVKGIRGMAENSGEVFIDQVEEFMQYKVPAKLSTEFLEMLGLLQRNKKSVEIIKCKSAVESKIYDCRDMLIEISQQIDGISYEYYTFARADNGDLIPCDKFAKKIVVNMKNKESVGINNEFVFACMEDSYYDVGLEINTLIEKLEWLLENFEKYDEKSDKIFDECQEIIYSIEEESKKCLESIDISLAFIDKIEKDSTEVELQLESFNKKLSGVEGSLGSDIYKELEEEKEMLLKHPLSNLGDIKKRLNKNREIIEELTQIYNCGYNYSESGIEKSYNYIKPLEEKLKGYRIDDIRFDYSEVKREIPEKTDGSMNGLKEIIDVGIARICISNYDKLSKNQLTDSGLVSANLNSDNSSKLSVRIEKIISSPKEAMGDMVDKLLTALEEEVDVEEILSKSTKEIKKEILFSYYVGEYFTSLTNTSANSSITHSLAYEQEYIIIGERADRGNIKGIVKRLLGIRMAINFICIFGDARCREQALVVSTGLTGFLGMPAVTYLVSTIIQSIWAYEESVVDVCAITQGRYVPLIKTGVSLKVQGPTIFTFGKAAVENLARQYPTTDSPTDFGYDEYLRLFVMLLEDDVAVARTMDLIQSNINVTYNKKINFARLIFGWDMEAEFGMKGIFAEFPFIQAVIKTKKTGKYEIKLSYANSY